MTGKDMKDKLKVFIVTEGGGSRGYGHMTRCLALYHAFLQHEVRPVFIASCDRSAEKMIEGADRRIFDWVAEEKALIRTLAGADIAIIDSYLAPPGLYARVAEAVRLPVYIDDNKRVDYPAGVILNSGVGAENIEYTSPGGKSLLGCEYALLRKDFWSIPRKKINKQVSRILVTFGGADQMEMTRGILDILNKKYPGITKDVVAGGASSGIKPRENVSVIHDADAGKMKSLMLDADIAVSAAGQTLYELAAAGTPAVAVCVALNQRSNLRGWQKAGVFRCIDAAGSINVEKELVEALEELMPLEEREKASEKAISSINAEGPVKAVREILRIYADRIFMRKTGREDCRDLWQWRNHPEVRKWAFTDGEIDLSDHREWFEKKMKDNKSRMYMAEYPKGQKIGQARFDALPGDTLISVNLNPAFFGKGLGSGLIRSATGSFLNERPEVKTITANIRSDNIASKKAFEKAGYRYSGNTTVQGCKTDIYKYTR
ncbi:MAG: GNAT family N-acetyltransferase [Candidatus Omnitrophica bacterium]|nr:GNAT family N-acetyltransferase [Candidatus Omnitrophota bacterium]